MCPLYHSNNFNIANISFLSTIFQRLLTINILSYYFLLLQLRYCANNGPCQPQAKRAEGEVSVPGPRRHHRRQHVGRTAARHARRAHGVLGHRHVARRQRALCAAAAAREAAARGMGTAVLYGASYTARKRRYPVLRTSPKTQF